LTLNELSTIEKFKGFFYLQFYENKYQNNKFISKNKYLLNVNAFKLDIRYFLKTIENIFKDIPSKINILLFGQVSSGKSTWCNTVFSTFSKEIRFLPGMGGTTSHSTVELDRLGFETYLNEYTNLKLTLVDTYGLKKNVNFYFLNFFFYLIYFFIKSMKKII